MSNPLPPGTILRDGKYRIRALHKMAGQSIVYEGEDVESGQRIIIKQTYEGQDWAHDVLRQEASLLGSLRHRSLPRVLDCFSERGSTFLVLSRIPGNDVGELLRRRGEPFPHDQVLAWADQLLDILEYLHAQEVPVVHRDINPRNVRLTPDDQIFLLDFGISKRTDLRTFLVGGTPHYAPPEQLKDEGTDPRTDLYAFAATMYFLLTAKEPPDSLSRESAILKGRPDPLRSACELNPEVPQLVSQVLSIVLSLEREGRPAGAAILRQWLREADAGVFRYEEDVTRLSPKTVKDSDRARESYRKPDRIIVPLEAATRGDATPEARELLDSLGNSPKLNPSIIQVLIQVMDSKPEDREEVLAQHAVLVKKTSEGKSLAAARLASSLASGSYIEPAVKQRLRQRLGRFLADHTLSNFQAPDKRGGAEAAGRSARMGADTIRLQYARRKWIRSLAIWLLRGVLAAALVQLIVSLLTGQTIVASVSSGSGRAVWAAHLLLLIFGSLLTVMIRKTKTALQYEEGRDSVSYIIGFLFGVILVVVLCHDAAWMLGRT